MSFLHAIKNEPVGLKGLSQLKTNVWLHGVFLPKISQALFPSAYFATFSYYITFFFLDKILPHLVCTNSKEGLCSTLGAVDPHETDYVAGNVLAVTNVAISLGAESLKKS